MEDKFHWGDSIAEQTIQRYGDREIICSSGITPSGMVHIGNFRDILTSDIVCRAIKEKGKKAKLVFFWDDFDRFRKVPKNVDSSFEKYIGNPVSQMPSPFGEGSYADFFKKDFEDAVPKLGIDVEFVSQTEAYSQNRYYKGIKTAMQKRKEIARILADFKTQGLSKKDIENYYPLQVYCTACNKDTTKIIGYDGQDAVTYKCACRNEETLDISKKNIGKLQWKVDWAMRWTHYKVAFEPAGKDHATVGGSFDVSGRICREIFGYEGPIQLGFEFVKFSGHTSKMSSSSGIAITPKDLLRIYEPELMRFMFTRTKPRKEIALAFDSAMIKIYDEFDRHIEAYYNGKADQVTKRALDLAIVDKEKGLPKDNVPFRIVSSFGQIAQGNITSLSIMLERAGVKHDPLSLKKRLEITMSWIEEYMPEARIKLRDGFNNAYYESLADVEKEQIDMLHKGLLELQDWDTEKIDLLVYGIPKSPEILKEELAKRQKAFFRNIYNMLIDKDAGPRLSTFILGIGRDVLKLLNDEKK